jgi:hypothetical protein
MKKLVLTLAIMAMAAITAIAQEQTYKFPGWDCKDMAVIQQQTALAPDDYSKIYMAILTDFAQNGTPETIEAAFTRIDGVISAMQPNYLLNVKLIFVKQWAKATKVEDATIKQYCINNPSSYDLHIALADNTDWGYQTVADCLLKYRCFAGHVIRAVDYLNRQAIALGKSDEEVLDLLKKLNRIFSAQLIEDKEAWGGVVAQIRTMMETYK